MVRIGEPTKSVNETEDGLRDRALPRTDRFSCVPIAKKLYVHHYVIAQPQKKKTRALTYDEAMFDSIGTEVAEPSREYYA